MMVRKIRSIQPKAEFKKKMFKVLQKIAANKKLTKPVIYGIYGTKLTDEEKRFFSQNSCLGFILFARNIENKDQLKTLTNSLRDIMEGEILILIDQEGGRIARLKPPHWPSYPSGKHFSEIFKNDEILAKKEVFENFSRIAADLKEVGINVNCAPVLDILSKNTHQIIGDRAYGENAIQVAELGKAACDGLVSQEVFPVIKHIPGHGRSACDSHLELPKVDVSFKELKESDFVPFKILRNQKFAMTAHILYTAIDSTNCATTSKSVISVIRDEIGFKNILMSDDISMKALGGSFSSRTTSILNAGCDLILHCNGNMEEMIEINSVLPNLNDRFWNNFIAD